MQREWIGRSEGADVVFSVADSDKKFTVFTTRPDTLFGATYCVLAPEHPLSLQITTPEHLPAVQAYIEAAGQKSAQDRMKDEKTKTGVFTGAYAVNPVNDTRIPIWIADYVLASTATARSWRACPTRATMSSPSCFLPIIEVISGGDIAKESLDR